VSRSTVQRRRRNIEAVLPREVLLTWITAYWLSVTIGSSFGPNVEFVPRVSYVSVPSVVSAFAHDTKPMPCGFASRFVNVQGWVEHENGSHFAAWEQPEAYVADPREAEALRCPCGSGVTAGHDLRTIEWTGLGRRRVYVGSRNAGRWWSSWRMAG
jgi:hypothetical protein